MIKRRVFLKNALKTIGYTGLYGCCNGMTVANSITEYVRKSEKKNSPAGKLSWNYCFESSGSTLSLTFDCVEIKGGMSFKSDGVPWSVDYSRDGVDNRFALIDPSNNVQGYWCLLQNGTQIQIHFYHRTAQCFRGEFLFAGTIRFFDDAFACRTKAVQGERVLSLAIGNTDSLLDDSLYSPQNDSALRIEASSLSLHKLPDHSYSFQLSGAIHEARESTVTLCYEKQFLTKRYVPYFRPIDRRRCPKTPTGWMSWNTYFDKATATDNLNEAKIGQKYLQPFGCDIWSIESWQDNSDQLPVSRFYNMNLEVNKKQFPLGMKNLADEIRKLGFRPGLWTAPFGTGNEEFYKQHKDWFLHNEQGAPISSWNGKYTLDPTVKEARLHLREIHRIASREWGYEFFKIDGMSGRNQGYCAHLYERPEIKVRFSDPTCKNPFELCIQAFREGIGDDRLFLACQGHTTGPEAAYADASRIGADIVHPNKPVEWAGVINQARCFMNQAYTHNISMIADPDTLLVRELPIEEARTSATIVALPGQLTFFGDKLSQLSSMQMRILQQTLPAMICYPTSLFPHFSMLPVWNLRVGHKTIGNYNVVALFNWEDHEKTISVSTQELGILRQDYSGYEFWTNTPLTLCVNQEALSFIVPAHGVRVIALHPMADHPQWLSSDRHITQCGYEISAYQWNETDNSVEGVVSLVKGFPLTMTLRVPERYQYRASSSSSAGCTGKIKENGEVNITFNARESGDSRFKISFTRN